MIERVLSLHRLGIEELTATMAELSHLANEMNNGATAEVGYFRCVLAQEGWH